MRNLPTALRSTLALAFLVVASIVPAHAEDTRPAILRDVGIDQHLNEQVPLDLPFRDETGKRVRLGSYFGSKPVILVLAYYECPMLCTLVINGLAKSLNAISFNVGKEFEVVTVSINPKETPALAAAKKQTYLKEYHRPGAALGWHFLTGEEDSIHKLAHAVGFRYVYDAEKDQYAHAAGIMVLTPAGKIARYFYGVDFSPRDLRLGLVEASKEKIGTPVDQVLLYCFHYDPLTGRYSAMTMNLIRLGGAITVLTLGTFMLVMWRRDARQNRREAV